MTKLVLHEGFKNSALSVGRPVIPMTLCGVLLIPVQLLAPLPPVAIKLYSTSILALVFGSLWLAFGAVFVKYGLNVYTAAFAVFMVSSSFTFAHKIIEVLSMLF